MLQPDELPVRKRAATLDEFAAANDQRRERVQMKARRPFQPLPTDIFIATFLKCGTAWMQQIVHGLRTRGSMDFDDISNVVPFFEMASERGIDLDMPQVAEPRAFKTHLRWESVPQGARYIGVIRHPGDALVSWYHSMNGLHFEKDAISPDDLIRRIVINGPGGPWGQYWEHLRSWWSQHENKEVLFLCFEDIKRDLAGAVRRVAQFMGLDADGALLELVTRQTSFDYMKQHEGKFNGKSVQKAIDQQRGLRSEENLVKIRSGRIGDRNRELSGETQNALDAIWKREIEETLGFSSYDDVRAHVAARQTG